MGMPPEAAGIIGPLIGAVVYLYKKVQALQDERAHDRQAWAEREMKRAEDARKREEALVKATHD